MHVVVVVDAVAGVEVELDMGLACEESLDVLVVEVFCEKQHRARSDLWGVYFLAKVMMAL